MCFWVLCHRLQARARWPNEFCRTYACQAAHSDGNGCRVPKPGTLRVQANSRFEQVSPQNPLNEKPDTRGATKNVSKAKHLSAMRLSWATLRHETMYRFGDGTSIAQTSSHIALKAVGADCQRLGTLGNPKHLKSPGSARGTEPARIPKPPREQHPCPPAGMLAIIKQGFITMEENGFRPSLRRLVGHRQPPSRRSPPSLPPCTFFPSSFLQGTEVPKSLAKKPDL